jgi:hypothetical protein
MAITGARFTIEYGCLKGPCDLTEPRHTGMPKKIKAPTAVAGGGYAIVYVELGPLAIQLGLGDIPTISQPPGIGESFAEHGRDEGRHSFSRVPGVPELVQPDEAKKVSVRLIRRDPPLKQDATRAGHSKQIAIPCGFRGRSGKGTVGVMLADEVVEVGEKAQCVHETVSSVSTTSQPSFR